MTFSEIFDQFFWSLVLALFTGLVWLALVDPVFPHIMVGVVVAFLVGGAYFSVGITRLVRQKRLEKRLEDEAYRELMEEMGREGDNA